MSSQPREGVHAGASSRARAASANTSTTMIDNLKGREDAAWRKVVARETGQRYLSEYQIKTDTNLPPRRIRDMVDRCRAMRRALGTDVELPGDWWTARLMPLAPAIATDTSTTTTI